MMSLFDMLKMFYQDKTVGDDYLNKFVAKGKITADQFAQITGHAYVGK